MSESRRTKAMNACDTPAATMPVGGTAVRAPRRSAAWLAVAAACLTILSPAMADDGPNRGAALAPASSPAPGLADGLAGGVGGGLTGGPKQWASPEGLTSAMQVMLLLTVISLAPAVLMMTTSFIRIVVVLGLLRQALGTQQLPPSQVITSLALFMSLVIMTPVWKQVYDDAIEPYTNPQKQITLEEAWRNGVRPVRKFMSDQIVRTGNDEDVRLFLDYLPPSSDALTGQPPKYVYYGDEPGTVEVPLQALLPAFMLSELKTAFLIGFQIWLPFLIIDMVVSSVTISMGMLMLPPVLISLPFKLLLFVLLDGWHLVVKMLLDSFQTFT